MRRRPDRAALLVGGGAVASVAGIVLLTASVAPMWGFGPDVTTLPAPPTTAQPPASGTAVVNSGSTSGASPSSTPAAETSNLDHPVDGVAFSISVPALNYQATVVEGVDLPDLERGPGHYPTSSWPGHRGTVGVAAHNVYWLSFSRLKPGDRVVITTRRATFVYQINQIKVTDPNDRTVLVPSSGYRLVLTTCYPLWAGAFATQRLIFFASQVGNPREPAAG